MKLVSSPNGSIFDQLPHICAEVLDAKFSLSAILLFEREEYLLLYESLDLDLYNLFKVLQPQNAIQNTNFSETANLHFSRNSELR